MHYLQLEPCRLTWPWLNAPGHRNDFFQYATHEVLGVGGAGHWAISLDEDLIRGSSRPCDTFGSPCLVSGAVLHVSMKGWGLSFRAFDTFGSPCLVSGAVLPAGWGLSGDGESSTLQVVVSLKG